MRKADKDGRVQIDGNYYLAGPSWRGWTLDVGLRAFDVTIRTQDGRTSETAARVRGFRRPRCATRHAPCPR